ncbi:hypothetical protein [Emticicia sp. 21SJ11W-3]|uniref:hypothetical protein n=1 Tax=Emticicia sp. 21SJ11W-3 TaxID=2916755 RepID=UPI00209ECB57|nr:hypothetical protein [Emticicia sp. 21SJ11W-3]UTA67643.1 hypothetical protein MB380_18885 [Emticicia sp. 21SJ11W-3]
MKPTIPTQREGTSYDTVSEESFSTEKQAKAQFQISKQRLLAVNHWHEVIGSDNLQFKLIDARAEPVDRLPMVGDYIKIEIPGPTNTSGEGYDWVIIENIVEDERVHEEFISITIRPSANPQKKAGKEETAHFFDDAATNTFIVKRKEMKLKAEVHGRNEKPNIEGVGLIDKIRNTFVAFGGILGASKLQWKSLTDGLLV